MAKQSTNDSKTNTVKETYFLPEYGVAVEASSIEEAVEKAKKTKGNQE